MIRVLAILFCWSLLLAGPTQAAGPGGNAERRIALVIGNNEYRYVTGLSNAVADARASGLARDGNRVALGFENRCELAQLRGFAGAVEAFEGEEESSGHIEQGIGWRV